MSKLLLVGDFNFHWNVPNDPDTIKLKDLLQTFNLTQFVTDPTHISGNTLDFIITRSDDNIVDSTHAPHFFSDHAAVHCKMNLQKPALSRKVISYRKWKAIDKQKFTNDLLESDLFRNHEPDLDKLVKKYDSTLTRILDDHAPLKQRTVTIRPHNPWYSSEIDEAKKIRKRLERRWRNTKLEIDRQIFKKQRLVINEHDKQS